MCGRICTRLYSALRQRRWLSIKDCLKSDRFLQSLVHIAYAIPPHRLLVLTRARWHWSALSIAMVMLQWMAFSVEMYVAKTYWSGGGEGTVKIPTEALLLVISLMLSGAFSYTLFVVYYYRAKNKFNCNERQTLIAHFEFTSPGIHHHCEEMKISPSTWKCVNILVILGILGIALVVYCAIGLNLFFDFSGLHDFTKNISGIERIVYYSSIFVINWGYLSDIVACCVFYIICADMIRHIQLTEEMIIKSASTFSSATRIHECLLSYIDNVIRTIRPWFVVHSIFFVLITLTIAVELIVALSEWKGSIPAVLLSQTAGCLLIVFKYAFPFISASKVTTRFEQMYFNLNRKCCPETFPELDVFMSYCARCRSGFTIFGFRITAQLALISVLSSFVGFFQLYRSIKKAHML